MQQVLFTLAVNAADAMPDGGEIVFGLRRPDPAELREHCPPAVDADTYWCLDVSDTGIGMDRETQERIFEPFFTTKEKTQGTGIGLPVVEMIVRLHRGWVSVRSAPGAGTTFTIGLPSDSVSAWETMHDTAHLPEVVQGNHETLLIVDDEETIRVMLEEVFTTNGYRVLTANSAGAALDILSESPDGVDLVLTDIGLPDMNGKSLITKVRALLPEVPVIAMTGYIDEGLVDTIYAIGADAVERKPYDIHKLSQEIARLLHKSPANTDEEME